MSESSNHKISFTAEDCSVFERYPNTVKWPTAVASDDQTVFKSIWDKLKSLSHQLANSPDSPIPLKANTSLYSPNGRSPKEIWCCVHPSNISNKSYGLQIAMIISERGAEVCFCQGSGTSQISDSAKKNDLEEHFVTMRKLLSNLPQELIAKVEESTQKRWFFRKSWLTKPNKTDFPTFAAWLSYAGSLEGSAASVSIYFTPRELEALGSGIFQIFSDTLKTFGPVFQYVYPIFTNPNHWIFQGNTDYFDVDRYLLEKQEIVWSTRQHTKKIKTGDQVLIWKSGSAGGVIAECSVIAEPSTDILDDAMELWKKTSDNQSSEMRCKLQVLRAFVDKPIPRAVIAAMLPELSIIKSSQGSNFPIKAEDYQAILNLKNMDAPLNPFRTLLSRYFTEKIVFISSAQKHRYNIDSIDDDSISIARIDAKQPARLTFTQAERLLEKLKTTERIEFTSLDSTSAIRNTILQAEPVALSADGGEIIYLEENSCRLRNFISVLSTMKRENRLYKPVMILCVLDGISLGELTENKIEFDWIAPRFIQKMKTYGQSVTEREAAQPFFYLTSDNFWLHAVTNFDELMQGGDGPAAARKKVKYALIKDTYWNLLKEPESLNTVRLHLESLMTIKPPQEKLLGILSNAFIVKGLVAETNSIQSLFVSLATKSFVILTGASGTGKTRLAESLARYYSREDSKRFSVVAVGADWTDKRHVLGFVNHLRTTHTTTGELPLYQTTPVLDLLLNAQAPGAESIPHFLVLDEMNLSHVERYFADFLSAMERPEGNLELHSSGADRLPRYVGDTIGVPPVLAFPRNLFVIGTVNVDETTYMFSPKVLDRANVIEFRMTEDNLRDFFSGDRAYPALGQASVGEAQSFLELAKNRELEPLPQAVDESIQAVLLKVFSFMEKARFEFGYRAATEVLRYLTICRNLQGDKTAWDYGGWKQDVDRQILQKLLPRLHGGMGRMAALLTTLGYLCHGTEMPPGARLDSLGILDGERALFPHSYRKISAMAAVLREEQFVSFIC